MVAVDADASAAVGPKEAGAGGDFGAAHFVDVAFSPFARTTRRLRPEPPLFFDPRPFFVGVPRLNLANDAENAASCAPTAADSTGAEGWTFSVPVPTPNEKEVG